MLDRILKRFGQFETDFFRLNLQVGRIRVQLWSLILSFIQNPSQNPLFGLIVSKIQLDMTISRLPEGIEAPLFPQIVLIRRIFHLITVELQDIHMNITMDDHTYSLQVISCVNCVKSLSYWTIERTIGLSIRV